MKKWYLTGCNGLVELQPRLEPDDCLLCVKDWECLTSVVTLTKTEAKEIAQWLLAWAKEKP